MTRLILRLYPRRFRRRYGDELLDLGDELRNRGEISRGRLLRDLVAGTLATRRPARSARLAGLAGLAGLALIAVAVLLATGTVSLGRSAPRRVPTLQARVLRDARKRSAGRALRTRTVPRFSQPGAQGYGTCFVGTVCTGSACPELIADPATVSTVPRLTVSPPAQRLPKSSCVSVSRVRRARAILTSERLGIRVAPAAHVSDRTRTGVRRVAARVLTG